MIKHLPSLAILAVATGIFAAAPAAHADSLYGPLSVTVWTGSTVPTEASLPTPGGTPTFTFNYTGPLDFVNNTMSANTFGDFFGSYSSGITGLTSAQLTTLLGTTMSTSGYGITSYLSFVGTYTGGGAVSISHDDGTSLYTGTGYMNNVISSPNPTSEITTTGTLPMGTNTPFDLIYVEANGAPADLVVTGLSPVPEPGTIGLLALGMIGLGALMYRGSAFNS